MERPNCYDPSNQRDTAGYLTIEESRQNARAAYFRGRKDARRSRSEIHPWEVRALLLFLLATMAAVTAVAGAMLYNLIQE